MNMHTNRHQEAKLLPPDTFLSRKKCPKMRLRPGLRPRDPAGGAYSSPSDSLAGNAGGAPGKGVEKERRGGDGIEGRGGKGRGRAIPPNENPGYGLVVSIVYLSMIAL